MVIPLEFLGIEADTIKTAISLFIYLKYQLGT